MKILITGTHFTPAQAVIEEFKKYGEVEILYVGRKTTQEGDSTLSVEGQILPKLEVKFIPLVAGRVSRHFSIYTIISLFKIPIGFLQAFYLILREQPDVILSFGGYVSVPVVFWGWWFSVPIIAHEQTLVTGLANLVNNLFADKIAVSFNNNLDSKNGKLILTGNPIRKELINSKNAIGSENGIHMKLPIIYVTGGNQGSITINNAIEKIISQLTKIAKVFHQTGDFKNKEFERMEKVRDELKNTDRYVIKRWFDAREVGEILNRADLVISRAGANTLLESAYFGVPTIAIPLPHLHKNEQKVNARYFEKLGLAYPINQNELTAKRLLGLIKQIIKNNQKYKKKALKANSVIIEDAAKRLALETLILNKRNNEVF